MLIFRCLDSSYNVGRMSARGRFITFQLSDQFGIFESQSIFKDRNYRKEPKLDIQIQTNENIGNQSHWRLMISIY